MTKEKILTLKEYCQREAKRALNSETLYRVYSEAFFKWIDITKPTTYLNEEDTKKVIRAREVIEELKQIASGNKISPIYEAYYYNVYLKELNN